jgi:putative acetyltransferase
MRVRIVEAGLDDVDAALRVERAAFGHEREAELVVALLEDPSAEPHLSRLALVDNKPLGRE